MKKVILSCLFLFCISLVYAKSGDIFATGITNANGNEQFRINSTGKVISVVGIPTMFSYIDATAVSTDNVYSIKFTTASIDYSRSKSSTTVGNISNPREPRCMQVNFFWHIGNSTTSASGNCIIYGYDALGNQTSETIACSTTVSTGDIAFTIVSTITWQLNSATYDTTSALQGIHCNIGCSNRVGLYADIDDYRDVSYVREDNTSYSPISQSTSTINTTYDYIIFNSAPSGTSDYFILIRQGLSR